METPQIPNYEIIELIGEGGMGLVWKAVNETMNRTVAIKVMHANFAHNQDFRERFGQEARTTGNLEHQNIIRIYEFNNYRDTLYLVMELANSGDLKGYMKQHIDRKGRPLDIDETLDIAKSVAEALIYAFTSLDVIHRDIKPANVLLHRDNLGKLIPKLTDFGLARLATGSDTIYGTPVGTLAYMSPEQCEGLVEVTHESDIYSFGVMLYEMVTGELPFQPRNFAEARRMHVEESFTAPSILRPQIPKRLEKIIEKCLAKRPHERYRTTFDIKREIERLQQGSGRDNSQIIINPQQQPRHLQVTFEGTVQRPTTELLDGDSLILGRPSVDGNVKADIVLDTKRDSDRKRVSRRHLQIRRVENTIYVTDLSGNGSHIIINGQEQRLPSKQEVVWEMGQTIRIENFLLDLRENALLPQPQIDKNQQTPSGRGLPPSQPIQQPPPVQHPVQPPRQQTPPPQPSQSSPENSIIGNPNLQRQQPPAQRNTPNNLVQPSGFNSIALDIEVKLQEPGRIFAVQPGGAVVVRVMVSNKSENVHHLTINTSGEIPRDWVTANPPELRLTPNEETRPVDITIKPPKKPSSRTGEKSFQINFQSLNTQESIPVSATIDILPYWEMYVEMLPEDAFTNSGTATLIIENRGNTKSSYRLGFIDSQKKVKVGFDVSQLSIEPGHNAEVSVLIKTQERRQILGINDRAQYNITVSDLAPDAPTDTLGRTLNITPWIHRDWIRNGMIALGILTALFAMLYSLVIRPANADRNTQQTQIALNETQAARDATDSALAALALTETSIARTEIFHVTETAAAPTPTPPDSDGDRLTDAEEQELGTEPNNPDTDGDGLSDGDEVRVYQTNPLARDTDGDGLTDGEEVNIVFTNPNVQDTDGDGINDGLDSEPRATPTFTPEPTSTSFVPTPTMTLTPAGGVCGFLEPRLAIGMVGRVALGGLPQRIRAEPGLDGEFLNSAPPGTLFRVVDGEACADNITWWKVQADGYPEGWMAEGQGTTEEDYFIEPCPDGVCPEGG